MKVMIVVTHLLGTGHLSRANTLARAFRAAGHDLALVSGGMPAPQLDLRGIEIRQLPAVRSDGTAFSRLLTETGAEAGPEFHAKRKRDLLEALDALRPDVLITELFPFGRRALASEFEALLDAAERMTPRPVILSSVRDILASPSKPAKARRSADLIGRFYDAVLVHSDPAVTPLEVSWPVTPELAPRLRYTGFVAPPPAAPHPDGLGRGEILVSAGGGAVGQPIFRAAIEAARKITNRRWRLLVGGRDPQEQIGALHGLAPGENLRIEPARPEFRSMLPHAAASVSMCGYNTAMDLLQSGVPAVLVPFDAGKEVEQSLRADSLSRTSGMEVLTSAALTPLALADAVARVTAAGPRPHSGLNFDGAAQSVRIATELVEAQA